MIYTLPWHIYSLTQNTYTVDKTKWNFTGCIHSECLCSTGVFMKQHCMTQQNVQRHDSTFFQSLPVSENIQLVIW